MDISFTLIQTNIFWEDKAANLQMLEKKIASLKGKTEVIILPEMFTTGFTMQPQHLAETMYGPTVEWMRNVAAKNKIVLTGSIIIKESAKSGDETFNRLIWMLPNGQYGYYDKRHLFAYGGEDKFYTPGNKRLIASVKGWKINLQICYDLRFPVWARQNIDNDCNAEYEVLIYVANWPERRIKNWQVLLQARAIENQCYVIGVNRTGADGNNILHNGNSMVISPLGDILYQKLKDEDIFTITLKKDDLEKVRQKFPFLKDADAFKIF